MAVKIYLAFYRGKSWFPSKLIRWFTWSQYSHVSMAVSDGDAWSIYEAWHKGGVRKTHAFKDGHEPGTRIDLYEFARPLDSIAMEQAIKAAEKDIGKGYDFAGIFGFLSRANYHNRRKLFCSEACMNWLLSAGRVLLRIESWKSSPGMLAASPELFPCGRYGPGSGPSPAT